MLVWRFDLAILFSHHRPLFRLVYKSRCPSVCLLVCCTPNKNFLTHGSGDFWWKPVFQNIQPQKKKRKIMMMTQYNHSKEDQRQYHHGRCDHDEENRGRNLLVTWSPTKLTNYQTSFYIAITKKIKNKYIFIYIYKK